MASNNKEQLDELKEKLTTYTTRMANSCEIYKNFVSKMKTEYFKDAGKLTFPDSIMDNTQILLDQRYKYLKAENAALQELLTKIEDSLLHITHKQLEIFRKLPDGNILTEMIQTICLPYFEINGKLDDIEVELCRNSDPLIASTFNLTGMRDIIVAIENENRLMLAMCSFNRTVQVLKSSLSPE